MKQFDLGAKAMSETVKVRWAFGHVFQAFIGPSCLGSTAPIWLAISRTGLWTIQGEPDGHGWGQPESARPLKFPGGC